MKKTDDTVLVVREIEMHLKGRLKAAPTAYQRKDGTWASSYELTAETVRFLTAKVEQVESTDLDVPF